ncbi:glutaredoxin family protein [Candidatus Micrarchaeota archaeon]|nr:glutaredoxin family protein [Candidatus Micrarchaeota archaeon]MBU1166168.1 glutaredoxin family protein [Candidatus Micrarchaeota archaeon]MBU1886566.1 glutaredoxin family protein [Candidatus Micrarchaeota archaeon]
MEKPRIIVYSVPTCQFCNMAKSFFNEKKIEFQDLDVSTDENIARQMVAKSRQTAVPVIDINGTILVGFDQEKVEKTLSTTMSIGAKRAMVRTMFFDPFDR